VRSRAFVAAFAIVVAAACASQQQDTGPAVSMELDQFSSPAEAFLYPGATNVQYQITVHNETDQPVTLRHLRLQTSGGGAYVLRANDTPMNLQVGPRSSGSATFAVWGTALGGQLFAHAPVTIRMTGYFDSPKGAFLRAGTVTLSQQ
jgi:hypothetical protein